MKRVACTYFPRWPLQRLRHQRPELRDEPLVVVAGVAGKPRVALCSEEAEQLGIRPGLTAADVQAVHPGLTLHDADPDADRRLLERLAEWMNRYSPCVGLEEGPAPEALLADVTGCGAVFGGEERLRDQALRELREQGWNARLAIAGTPGTAWALAHFAQAQMVVPAAASEKVLRPLSVAALRLPDATLSLLHELGVDRVGELLEIARAEIPARFGAGTLQRLDQALGHVPEVILPCRMVSEIQAAYRFECPVDHQGVLRFAFEKLTEQVHEALQRRGLGARQLELTLHHETGSPLKVEVSLFQPSGSLGHLVALLGTRLEQVQVCQPVTAINLRVVTAEPLAGVQAEFVDAERTEARKELAALIDRLSSRLGPEAVTRPTLLADAQPEHACRFDPVIQTASQKSGAHVAPDPLLAAVRPATRSKKPRAAKGSPDPPPELPGFAHRPLCLWLTPVRIEVLRVVPGGRPSKFCWAGKDFQVLRAWGPERIETGWWRGEDVCRDYYVVSTHAGPRFWLFRCRKDGGWFLHGCFE